MTTPKGGEKKNRRKSGDLRAAVLRVLLDGATSVPVLAEALDCDQNLARRLLTDLVAEGLARPSGWTARRGFRPRTVIYEATAGAAPALEGVRCEPIEVAAPVARELRRVPRSKAGSGVIAGPIQIRGYRWGARGGPW
jgi:predicted ArsR family transcriptional regulator